MTNDECLMPNDEVRGGCSEELQARHLMRNRRTSLVLLGVAAAGLGSGCAVGSSGRLSIRAVSDGVWVLPDAAVPVETDVFDEYSGRVTLASAINEVVAFQLVLRSAAGTVGNVRVAVGDLVSETGRISAADNVQLFREHVIAISRYRSWFLRLSGPGQASREYPDALIPLSAPRGGQPLSVPAGRNVPVWVDIRVPPGTEAGLYRTVFRITSGAGTVQEVPLELTVWPIALPDLTALSMPAAVDHETLFAHHLVYQGASYVPRRMALEEPLHAEAAALLDETFRLLHAHRLSPFLKRFYPTVKLTADRTVVVDWDDYDRAVTEYLDGTAYADRVPARAWPLPIDRDLPAQGASGPSPLYTQMFASYLKACAAHFREKGWYDRHFVWYDPLEDVGPDAPLAAVPSEAAQAFARRVRAAEPSARFLATYPAQDMGAYGWYGLAGARSAALDEQVSIFCPSVRWVDASVMRVHREAGRRTWFRPDEPPFSGSLAIEADPVQARSLAWAADRVGASAVLLHGVCDWGAAPWETAIERPAQRSDNWLIYPGGFAGLAGPVPSIRLKSLRRGLQDLAYLELLRVRGQTAIADLIAGALVKRVGTGVYGDHLHDCGPPGWARDPALWRLGRRLAANILADAPPAAGGLGALTARVEWTRFLQATDRVRVEVEGVRVRAAAAGQIEALVHVTVSNDRSQALSGRLRLRGLPLGWSSVVEEWAVANLAPGRRRRVTLTARASALAANAHGVSTFAVELAIEGEEALQFPVRATHLAVRRLQEPLRIDGDLSDWPPGLGNVAGDFVLVGAGSPERADGARPRSANANLAFVCRDDTRLFFALHCEQSAQTSLLTTRSNQVRYDRTGPTGEDLVEIVIDPTNGRTGSTGDLYHLIIKANGAVVAEQGIGWAPPTGARRVWAADVRAAVRGVQNGRWTVEVSVPLDAFGPDALRRRFWGIDFGRFDAATGEYASWSGARRHLYNPRGLGNAAM